MKKTPLKRKTPLKSNATLKTNQPLKQKTPLKSKQKTAKKLSQDYWSIFGKEGICAIDGTKCQTVPHHIFGGANKALSEKYGFILFLSPYKHTVASDSIHQDKNLEKEWRAKCELYYLEHYGDSEDWLNEFGRHYV